MGRREGVVDIDVAELGHLLDESRVVLFLALVEAGVLEDEDVAIPHFGDGVGGDLPDAVIREADRPLDDFRDGRSDGLQRIFLVPVRLSAGRNGRAG